MKNKNKIESGFKTPPQYFQNFNQKLKDRMKVERLDAEKSGFKVPDAYFDNLNTRIKTKIAEETKSEKASQSKVINLSYWMSTAAAVLVVLGSLWFFSLNKQANPNASNTIVIENLDQQLINLYVEDYILPYDDLSFDFYNEFQINDIAELDLMEVDQQNILNYFEDDLYDADFLNE